MQKLVLAIHGGAGTISKSNITKDKEKAYHDALQKALKDGFDLLSNKSSAIDAVEAAVKSMENSPLFNAGKGSVFDSTGKHEMEAAIMNGKDLAAGAVTMISKVKNPVELSRKIMENSAYVLLSGSGALQFAGEHKMTLEEADYFFTQERYTQWQKAQETGTSILDHSGAHKYGTVGAVALDIEGNVAAATSTGGLTNKKYGRIGDSALIGAGTYANNKTCAVSCTGYGEFFIRAVAGYDVSCLMEYKNMSLKQACEEVVMQKLKQLGGEGGLIALDQKGNYALIFNSSGMYRGWIDSEEQKYQTRIFK